MKKSLFVFLLIISYNVLAESTIETIDIINKSDIPVTVTYEECRVHVNYIEDAITTKCMEQKTLALSAIHNGISYAYIKPEKLTSKEEGTDISGALLIIRKISSSLGEQDFPSLDEVIKISNKIQTEESQNALPNLCIGTVDSEGSSWFTTPNVLVLDPMGTSKFYCQGSYQAS